MFTRLLSPLNKSFFLFGPRGTGKSTWIKTHYSEAKRYDLLSSSEALRLEKNPETFYQEVSSLLPQSWVVIDEIQKVPALLDEVHRLIEEKKLRFVLSGSSARKIKKGGANLLAGRAQVLNLFSLVSAEIDFATFSQTILTHGTLPMAYLSEDPTGYLKSYADTYLQEEIKHEALTRNVGAFSRFLEVAARQNAQITSVSNIARDAQVARQTVQGYFEILADTLIGSWLPAWKLKRATKQVAHPKFYFFDPGVARVLSGRIAYPLLPEEQGHLLETYVFHEVRSYLAYRKKYYPLYFWATPDQVEIDIFFETSQGFVGIEIKGSSRWDSSFNKGFKRISQEINTEKLSLYGVYLGSHSLVQDKIKILNLTDFLKKLWNDEIIK